MHNNTYLICGFLIRNQLGRSSALSLRQCWGIWINDFFGTSASAPSRVVVWQLSDPGAPASSQLMVRAELGLKHIGDMRVFWFCGPYMSFVDTDNVNGRYIPDSEEESASVVDAPVCLSRDTKTDSRSVIYTLTWYVQTLQLTYQTLKQFRSLKRNAIARMWMRLDRGCSQR